MTLHNKGLFIFTRDLRTQDNNGLNAALANCQKVYTAFFFTPEQVSSANKFKSVNAVQFMIESLKELSDDIERKGGKLIILYGKPDDCLQSVITRLNIDAVFMNKDITKYANERSESLGRVLAKHEKPLVEVDDYYLSIPGSVTSTSGGIYLKFTPYYNKVLSLLKSKHIVIDSPATSSKINRALSSTTVDLSNSKVKELTLNQAYDKFASVGGSPMRTIVGGRTNALKMIRSMGDRVSDYEATRNTLSDQTTRLSAYTKFGNVSVREVYYAFKDKLDKAASDSLIRQLFWRDFYAQLLNEYPNLLFHPMKEQYAKIKWSSSQRLLDAWENGETGFPIVDAGMREMAATGYMHNRARLIAGSFLPKTLFINWQKGEAHFARSLVDYDPASNNGNWQWVSGTGSDSQPYFRILNPFLQSAKYDPDAEYIKKWVPELADVPAKDIHKWDKTHSEYESVDYPAPIVDYAKQKDKVLEAYRSVS